MDAKFWNGRYGDGSAYGDAPNDFVREVVDRLPKGPTLCLAAGEGRNAVYLAEQGFGPVTALDQSEVGLQAARALADARGTSVSTVVGDLSEWAFGGPWTVITAIWAHVPPPVRERMFGEVRRSLAPGGALVLESYTPDQLGRGTGGPPIAAPLQTLAMIRKALPDLEFVIGRELERPVAEGKYHQGLSSVVQVLAFAPSAPSMPTRSRR